jgi:hypothetical protein
VLRWGVRTYLGSEVAVVAATEIVRLNLEERRAKDGQARLEPPEGI